LNSATELISFFSGENFYIRQGNNRNLFFKSLWIFFCI